MFGVPGLGGVTAGEHVGRGRSRCVTTYPGLPDGLGGCWSLLGKVVEGSYQVADVCLESDGEAQQRFGGWV